MLTLLGRPRRFCDGLTRRELLQAGSLSLLSGLLSAPTLYGSSGSSAVRARPGQSKAVISIFLHGGAATQDMWDLKPDAPVEVRGEFKPVATSAPGVRICEHLPKVARWMHRAALVRTVNHKAGCHNPLVAFTGCDMVVPEQANANPNHPPSMGAICEYLRQGRATMPAYVCLPHHLGWAEGGRRPGIYGGYLGQRYDPLCADCTAFYDPGVDLKNRGRPPELRGEPRLPHKVLQEGLTLDRLHSREDLLQQLEQKLRDAEKQLVLNRYDRTRERAFDVLSSARLRQAFDLERETPRLRDRYGRSLFGQSVLVARKLVESGVRFVNVFWDNYAPRFGVADYGWDTHELNFITLRDCFLPRLDRTLSALLDDLDQRGLLDQTLVLVHSDMGRTPRVNKDAGRDHWSYCYSAFLAGGGVRGGSVYGESDAHAASVKDRPASPADICATVYHCLGIDPEMPIHDRTARPVPVALGGKPLQEILV
jgi:hypothetical protein